MRDFLCENGDFRFIFHFVPWFVPKYPQKTLNTPNITRKIPLPHWFFWKNMIKLYWERVFLYFLRFRFVFAYVPRRAARGRSPGRPARISGRVPICKIFNTWSDLLKLPTFSRNSPEPARGRPGTLKPIGSNYLLHHIYYTIFFYKKQSGRITCYSLERTPHWFFQKNIV